MKRTKRTRPQMTLALPLDPAASNAELEAAVRAAEASFLAKPAEAPPAPTAVPATRSAEGLRPSCRRRQLLTARPSPRPRRRNSWTRRGAAEAPCTSSPPRSGPR